MSAAWVVTGVGIVSAAGDDLGALLAALAEGVPLTRPAPGTAPAPGAARVPVEGFDPKRYVQRRGVRDLSRTSQLACCAGAPLSGALDAIPASEVGVVLGTAWGSVASIVGFERQASRGGPRLVDPLLFSETVANVPAGQVSIFHGWSAFNATVSSGAASGIEAIREAVALLEEGRAAAAVAGGADELNLPLLEALAAAGQIAASPGSLPFSAGRAGPAGGEGACLLLIEEEGRARDRGARPLGRIRAWSARYAPRPGAGARAGGEGGLAGYSLARPVEDLLREALEEAGWRASGVDLIAASGDGSVEGDRDEAEALAAVFGAGSASPHVLAPKGILGETWGASGPLGAAAALGCMAAGTVPGRPRGFRPDPALPPLNFPEAARQAEVRRAAVLARSASGHLSALLLESAEGARGG